MGKKKKNTKPEEREYSQEELARGARIVLENPFWIPELEAEKWYARIHDDHDGTFSGSLSVSLDQNGDAWVSIEGVPAGRGLRFRTYFGGGQSERVRTALMILALAIKLDNEERSQGGAPVP